MRVMRIWGCQPTEDLATPDNGLKMRLDTAQQKKTGKAYSYFLAVFTFK